MKAGRSLWRLIFTQLGLFRIILWISQVFILNLSIFAVAIIGAIISPGWLTALMIPLSLLIMFASQMCSRNLSNLRCLRQFRKYLEGRPTCTFEFTSNEDLQNQYNLRTPAELITSPDQVQSSLFPTPRPNKELQGQSDQLTAFQQIGQRLLHKLTVGFRCILRSTSRLDSRSASFDAYSSRDYKFIVIPKEESAATPERKWMIAHELAHSTIISMENYFSTESMLRCILPLPLLLAAAIRLEVAAAILCCILIFYAYLRYVYYPSRLQIARFRDEVFADRFAVMISSADVLLHLMNRIGVLRRLVGGTSAITDAGMSEYRVQLLRDEIKSKLENKKPRHFLELMNGADQSGRTIAVSAHPYEGLIGVALVYIAVFQYEISLVTLMIAFGYLLALAMIWFLIYANVRWQCVGLRGMLAARLQ
ncbi:MAG: hypothetical protein AAF823_04795 [Planctomycetota bacterium]